MANAVDSALYLSNYRNEQKRTGSSSLGKDDFLKLLIAQLQNQDPTNPMEDKEFISQMANFSTLEQMTNMTSAIQTLVAAQEESTLISYSNFIGKVVNWHKVNLSDDGKTESSVEQGTGRISSVQFNSGSIKFILENGTVLDPGNISKVTESSSAPSLSNTDIFQASMLIGKKISYLSEEKEELTEEVKSVSFKGGKTTYHLADGTTIVASQITKIE